MHQSPPARSIRALLVGTLLVTLLGCESGPTMSSTTTARDTTLTIEIYEDRAPVILVSDDDRAPTTIETLNEAASQGDLHAHRLLGNAYWAGNGSTMNGSNPFPRNRSHAVWYYRKAAEAGDVPSQYFLGHALEFGDGIEQDAAAAFPWYQRAASQGHIDAHGQLGYFFVTGAGGVEIDVTKALEHMRFAARAGQPMSQFNLGVMYAKGNGVEQNLEEAARWYWSAADQGNTGAMVQLAKLLRSGEGIPKDEQAARQWLELAAEEGSDEALAMLDQSDGQAAATTQTEA